MIRMLPAAALLFAIAACSGSDEGTEVTTAQNQQSGEAETVIQSDNGWRLTTSQSAGVAAVYTPPGEEQATLAISCPIRNLVEVAVAGARPMNSEEKLDLSFGAGAPIALNAIPTIDRTGSSSPIPGAMRAAGSAPKELRSMMQSGEIEATYGSQKFGPFPAFPNNVRQRMINEC